MQKTPTEEVQLGEVFAQSRQNAEQLQSLGSKLDTAITELRTAIEQSSERSERLIEQVRRAASPNMGNIWMGVGVAISFIALLGTAFGYGINREISRLDSSFDKLDAKLQREQVLGSEVINREVSDLREDFKDMKSFQTADINRKLDELQQRRLKQ